MNILYAVQGTGNGHISRAIQLYPFLKTYGNIDFFISGSNADLKTDLPVIGRSKGISLFYKSTGGLDYLKIIIFRSWCFIALETCLVSKLDTLFFPK